MTASVTQKGGLGERDNCDEDDGWVVSTWDGTYSLMLTYRWDSHAEEFVRLEEGSLKKHGI